MRVWISKYRNHWISPYTIMEKIIFWREIDYDEPFIEKCSNILSPFCHAIKVVLDFIHPQILYVKINKWDTWSMDHTLAHIILPMLKQLRADKHGAPFVDDEDVPDELKSTSAPPKKEEWDTDDNHFKRWDYVLDEMIWAFEQQLKDDDELQFFDDTEVDYGKLRNDLEFNKCLKKIKVDEVGLKFHQERKRKGFLLFGKYYQALWD